MLVGNILGQFCSNQYFLRLATHFQIDIVFKYSYLDPRNPKVRIFHYQISMGGNLFWILKKRVITHVVLFCMKQYKVTCVVVIIGLLHWCFCPACLNAVKLCTI